MSLTRGRQTRAKVPSVGRLNQSGYSTFGAGTITFARLLTTVWIVEPPLYCAEIHSSIRTLRPWE